MTHLYTHISWVYTKHIYSVIGLNFSSGSKAVAFLLGVIFGNVFIYFDVSGLFKLSISPWLNFLELKGKLGKLKLEKTLILGGIGTGGKGDNRGWDGYQLDGREFEWTLGDGDGQGGLACCDSWGHKEADTTEWLNWTGKKNYSFI